ncbi:MAG TPA: orotidine-5'-phosphate decarboxylase [Pyrinomonadaceae bacterium]
MTAKDKLIIALDFDTATQALDLARELQSVAGMFKVGSQLFTAAGPQVVRDIIALGSKIFLDLKFHDIPNTVAGAARSAAELGVSLFNVHASGGSEMMRRAVESVAEVAERTGMPRSKVLAVSVLTSVDATILSEIGVTSTPEESVIRLVRLAESSKVDGVVASPQEIQIIRHIVPRPEFLIVTPGIRPANTSKEDQRRIATPKSAIAAGASYIVVGRAITAAPDPLAAAHQIVAEMQRAEATELVNRSGV